LAGNYHVDIRLGLEGPASHVERSEKEALGLAQPTLSESLSPAGRVFDFGVFAGRRTALVSAAIGRLKSIILLNSGSSDVQSDLSKLASLHPEAQIEALPYADPHGGHDRSWSLEPMGQGKTLAMCLSGAYSFMEPNDVRSFWQQMGRELKVADLMLITIEPPRDAARIEADEHGFGTQMARSCLAKVGRTEAMSPRVIYLADRQCLKFGAVCDRGASISWNGATHEIPAGTWIGCGSKRFLSPERLALEAEGFTLANVFACDGGIAHLVMLEKTRPKTDDPT
jgi:hypothetical protein